jgi:hypothetical protein
MSVVLLYRYPTNCGSSFDVSNGSQFQFIQIYSIVPCLLVQFYVSPDEVWLFAINRNNWTATGRCFPHTNYKRLTLYLIWKLPFISGTQFLLWTAFQMLLLITCFRKVYFIFSYLFYVFWKYIYIFLSETQLVTLYTETFRLPEVIIQKFQASMLTADTNTRLFKVCLTGYKLSAYIYIHTYHLSQDLDNISVAVSLLRRNCVRYLSQQAVLVSRMLHIKLKTHP